MTPQQKIEIEKMCREFSSGFKDTIGEISGSGFLIVDPLSGFLNFAGYKNRLSELPANEVHPQVLIITFQDGTQLIPAGSDLKYLYPQAKDWLWL